MMGKKRTKGADAGKRFRRGADEVDQKTCDGKRAIEPAQGYVKKRRARAKGKKRMKQKKVWEKKRTCLRENPLASSWQEKKVRAVAEPRS